MSSLPELDTIVVDEGSPDESSGPSPPLLDASPASGSQADPDIPVVVDETGDAVASPPTPLNPDEGEGCGHPRRPNDIHHSKCEPCRLRNGVLLCTHDNYCHSCSLLDDDTFQQMLDDREDNAKKLRQRKDRLAARKSQPPAESQRRPRLISFDS